MGRQVREPIQIYVAAEERQLLDALALDTGLSRAEILRRGLKIFASQRASEPGPMQRVLESLQDADWPADIARDHDRHLADTYRSRHGR